MDHNDGTERDDEREEGASHAVDTATWWSEPLQRRALLVIALTLVTGASDAIGFTRLGGVFTSVMTGNMVLLGVSAGKSEAPLALHAGAAFAGYVVGSFAGARIAGSPTRGQAVWPRTVTYALALELIVFAVFASWWEVANGHPSTRVTYALLAITSLALGIQSSAVLRFGIRGLSTTYLTGTLTQLVAGLTNQRFPRSGRTVSILLALIVGAVLGAVLTIEVPRSAPAVPVGMLLLVLVGAVRTFRQAGRP